MQHAAVLERAGIDYIDLAGNAHLRAPGLLVHVEGRRPAKEPVHAPGRPHKAWIKTVMALLVQPELFNAGSAVIPRRQRSIIANRRACGRLVASEGHETPQSVRG